MVPNARWEISSSLAPLLEDKGHFSRGEGEGGGVVVQQCVKQGPPLKSTACRTTGASLHFFFFYTSSCECVEGPSESLDVGIAGAGLQSSSAESTRDCFYVEEEEEEGSQREEDVTASFCSDLWSD